MRRSIDEIFDHFDYIAAITVNHPIPDKPSAVHITVFTGEASGFEEPVPLFDSGRSHAVIHTDDGERLVLPFDIIATVSGPEGRGIITKTPVYIADNVIGAEPLSVEDGLARLQSKIGKSCDEIRTMLRNERENSSS